MVGLGIRVPVAAPLTLDAGVRLSAFLPDAATLPPPPVGAPPPIPALQGPYPSVSLRALLQLGALALQVGGHVGREARPLRFEAPGVWNATQIVHAGAWVTGQLRTPDEGPGLSFGYQVLRLQPHNATDTLHSHVLSIGVFADLERGPRP